MERLQRARHRSRIAAQRAGVDRRTLHEPGYQAVGLAEDGGRRDPQRGRRIARESFGLAIDAQQRRVLAGESHDVIVLTEPHAEVAICDPSL